MIFAKTTGRNKRLRYAPTMMTKKASPKNIALKYVTTFERIIDATLWDECFEIEFVLPSLTRASTSFDVKPCNNLSEFPMLNTSNLLYFYSIPNTNHSYHIK